MHNEKSDTIRYEPIYKFYKSYMRQLSSTCIHCKILILRNTENHTREKTSQAYDLRRLSKFKKEIFHQTIIYLPDVFNYAFHTVYY